ncbi:MAG: hypothetical protein Unbinned1473contig1000_60 [Prokaryotic dsDNA virus sp.]|nr:MAG: hypothetical protein Unbinned1473contig1000_60 [Prokaryotic dsDNA virus sp.]|tara:strand:- start:4217 stop:4453 length:237 start_codon:yes stop_codon:yes gene_type:complete
MKKLEQEELEKIKSFMNDFQNLKAKLGDIAIAQNDTIKDIDALRKSHSSYEQKLVDKYGKDTVIDISTGEIKTKKENG